MKFRKNGSTYIPWCFAKSLIVLRCCLAVSPGESSKSVCSLHNWYKFRERIERQVAYLISVIHRFLSLIESLAGHN
jgi:hypothetical protein